MHTRLEIPFLTRSSCYRRSFSVAAACVILLLYPGAPSVASDPVLGPGDTIRVTVFQKPDLATEATISPNGSLMFPLVGEVKLVGYTPHEAAAQISDLLKRGQFVRNPSVNVHLVRLRSQSVSVLGYVGNPGQYSLDGSSTALTEVLAMAGGIADGGSDTVTVIRKIDGRTEKLLANIAAMYETGDLSMNIDLRGGDMVFVPRASVFYVYGAVQRPGAYRLDRNTSVLTALTLGGGLGPRGTERGLKIQRRLADGSQQSLKVDLEEPVKANDVILVQESVF